MIAVIINSELLVRLLYRLVICLSKSLNFSVKITMELFLGNAAKVVIAVVHRYVIQVVKVAEHTDLAELGDTCENREPDAGIHTFQRAIETFQRVPVCLLEFIVPYGLKHRLVIFIHQDDDIAPGLFLCAAYDALESCRKALF